MSKKGSAESAGSAVLCGGEGGGDNDDCSLSVSVEASLMQLFVCLCSRGTSGSIIVVVPTHVTRSEEVFVVASLSEVCVRVCWLLTASDPRARQDFRKVFVGVVLGGKAAWR